MVPFIDRPQSVSPNMTSKNNHIEKTSVLKAQFTQAFSKGPVQRGLGPTGDYWYSQYLVDSHGSMASQHAARIMYGRITLFNDVNSSIICPYHGIVLLIPGLQCLIGYTQIYRYRYVYIYILPYVCMYIYSIYIYIAISQG